MAKKQLIELDSHFDDFINHLLTSGKYSSVSEVVIAALRMFEKEELKTIELIKELKKGEASGFVKDFTPEKFMKELHKKHSDN